MLREIRSVRQIAGELRRRCFADEELDLTVWYDGQGTIAGFELCYDKQGAEHAFRWGRGGLEHWGVDNGEQDPLKNRTPVLVPDGALDGNRISRQFREQSREIDQNIIEVVLEKLARFSG